MGKRRSKKRRKPKPRVVGERWLPSFLIWGGVLLMLIGGILAYPTVQSYIAPPDAQSLEFRVTLAPSPPVVALQPTPHEEPTLTSTAETSPQVQDETATPTAPPPVILPETELVTVQETPTMPEPELPTEQPVTPEVTSEPTPTPLPTPTPDSASLIPGRLVIPSINLDAPVVQVGWETQEVNGQLVSTWIVPNTFAAGWHATSALPGNPGNTVLNGHHNIRGEVFRDLEDLQPGDEVVLYAGETPHFYSVTERHILEEKYQPPQVRLQNAQFILPTEDERLTMVTCWPYTNNTHRLIIVAFPMQPTPMPTSLAE